MIAQVACHLQGGGTRVENEAATRLHQTRRHGADALLDRGVEHALVGDGALGHRLAGFTQQGATVGAHRHPCFSRNARSLRMVTVET